jgi:parallel beta-helix repeat protein
MNLKISHSRCLLAFLAVVCVATSAVLPSVHAQAAVGPCPPDNNPYVLTTSLTLNADCTYKDNGIVLAASGITLNCAGNTISYTGTPWAAPAPPSGKATPTPPVQPKPGSPAQPGEYYGILVYGSGNTVENCKVTGFYWNFLVGNSPSTKFTGNTASNGGEAFWMCCSPSSTLTGNTATNNYYGIGVGESFKVKFSGNTATGSKASDGAGFYFEDDVGASISTNTATNNPYGFYMDIYFIPNPGMTLKGNKADNNHYGYYDKTYGTGTLGLGNTYSSNECSGNTNYGSYGEWWGYGPMGICTPQG